MNEVAEAGKNKTLAGLCKKLVDGCNKTETVADAGKLFSSYPRSIW